jgi:hypothetical protein
MPNAFLEIYFDVEGLGFEVGGVCNSKLSTPQPEYSKISFSSNVAVTTSGQRGNTYEKGVQNERPRQKRKPRLSAN